MNIKNVEVGKEYLLTHAYGQPTQRVKVLSKADGEIRVVYVGNDSTKGLATFMNTIECERYLLPSPNY